ncbi:hypothetical protein D9M72_408610 [compost metagenome]
MSRSSTVGAHQISTPLAYMAVRSSGMWFSQQMAPPMRPAAASMTGRVEPSPWPQIRRSVPVGMSLRCFAASPVAGSKKRAVQYSVLPPRSIAPTTRLAPVRCDSPASASVSGPGTSIAFS